MGLYLISVKSNRDRKIPLLSEEAKHIDRLVERVRNMRKTIILKPSCCVTYL